MEGSSVRPRWVYGLALLAFVPNGIPGQSARPRDLPAAWAMSGDEAAAPPPAVIASTRPGAKVLPAEARAPVPDGGLQPPPAKPAPAKADPPGPIQPAVYQTNPDAPPPNPIQQVAAPPAEA